MRFTQVLGVNTEQIKTRSFEYRGQTFKVKIPTIGQIEAFENFLKTAKNDAVAIEAIYQKRKDGLVASEQIVFTESDVLVEGKSLRELATNQHVSELRITWLFNLLVKVHDDGLGDLTYADINAELPMQLQTDIVDCISKAMVPEVEETKKNSTAAPADSSTSTSWPMAGDQTI